MNQNRHASGNPVNHKRRWFQFSARTLLLGMFAISLMIAVWSWHVRRELHYERLVTELKKMSGYADRSGSFFIRPSQAALDLVRTLPKHEIQTLGLGHFSESDKEFVFPEASDINDATLAELAALPELRRLVIRQTQITDRALTVLRRFPHLELLELDRNPLTDDCLEQLNQLSQLKSLGLRNTDFTDTGLAHGATLPQLTTLDLSGTRLMPVSS